MTGGSGKTIFGVKPLPLFPVHELTRLMYKLWQENGFRYLLHQQPFRLLRALYKVPHCGLCHLLELYPVSFRTRMEAGR